MLSTIQFWVCFGSGATLDVTQGLLISLGLGSLLAVLRDLTAQCPIEPGPSTCLFCPFTRLGNSTWGFFNSMAQHIAYSPTILDIHMLSIWFPHLKNPFLFHLFYLFFITSQCQSLFSHLPLLRESLSELLASYRYLSSFHTTTVG